MLVRSGGNIATSRAAFAQAHGTALSRDLPVASKLRCKLANWFMAGPVMRQARDLYGDKEGHHPTPRALPVTLPPDPRPLHNARPFAAPPPRPDALAVYCGARPRSERPQTPT